MENHAIPITQKLLVNAGGWPAMKLAQQLQKAGRVVEADYHPPLLSGLVREGNRNLRSGLRVKSESDVENLCTCRESREWGKICPHALAVGLAYIENATAKDDAAPAPAVVAKPEGPTFVEIGSEVATPIALHFILPPVFESAWTKQQIMVVTEVEISGKRMMPSALVAKEKYACDTSDLAAIDGLRELISEGDVLSAMRLFPRAHFLRLLKALRGHPRVTFGKSTHVRVASEVYRPRLHLARAGETISLEVQKAKDEQLLVAGEEAWFLQATCFRALPEALPNEFHPLADGPIVLRGERAQRFLAFEAQRLKEWFETDSDWVLPEVQHAVPRFVLNVEGSMRELRADLRAQYADGPRTINATNVSPEALFVRDPAHADSLLLRDIEAEQAALERLQRLGFTARGEKFVLANENAIARFFAFEFPRLKTEWDVHLSSQATKANEGLEPLAPKIEVVGSGENWFELRYSLGTPDGQAFSAAELQRLLRSGQSQTRLRNGRTGVFDAEAIGDFEEVLRDCEPKQNQPGLYRINRAHSRYLAETAQEVGATWWIFAERCAA